MNTSLGKTLRILRKGKQVSLTSLADDSLSKSQYLDLNVGIRNLLCTFNAFIGEVNLGLMNLLFINQR